MDFDNFIGGMDGGSVSSQMLRTLLNNLISGVDKPPFKEGRRFLKQRAYINSKGRNPNDKGEGSQIFLDDCYHALTEAGFEVVDCRNVGRTVKSNADVRIAMDIGMSLSGSGALLAEFIMVTGDADFAPVLQAIRAQDRWATLINSQSNASLALTTLADHYINEKTTYQLMGLLEISLAESEKIESLDQAKEVAVGYVTDLLANSEVAIPLPSLGVALRQKIGSDFIDDSDWLGYGKLVVFLHKSFSSSGQEEIKVSGEYVWRPSAHNAPQEFTETPIGNIEDAKEKAVEIAEAWINDAEEGVYIADLGKEIREKAGTTLIGDSEWFGYRKLVRFLKSIDQDKNLWEFSQYCVHKRR